MHMIVKYIHCSDPKKEKIYDTVSSSIGCMGLLRVMGGIPEQRDWDEMDITRFEDDKRRGIVLWYEIMSEE